jgi:hypothetical protein
MKKRKGNGEGGRSMEKGKKLSGNTTFTNGLGKVEAKGQPR